MLFVVVTSLSTWRAFAGTIALLWLVIGSTVFAALVRPGYDASHAISELGEQGSPTAIAWNIAGFGVGGVLMYVWSSAIRGAFGRSWLYGLVVLLSAGLIGSGTFSCDPGCPAVMTTWQGWAHTVVGLLCFALFVALPLVGWRTFRPRTELAMLSRGSLFNGLVLLGLFVAGPFLFGQDGVGYWQRLMIPLFGVWTTLVAISLDRSASLVAAGYRAH